MKHFVKWVTTQPRVPESVEPGDTANDDYSIETSFNVEGPDRIDTSGHGKEVLMPDIYADERVATEPELKDFDLRSPGVGEPSGFNPYDTGVLQKK